MISQPSWEGKVGGERKIGNETYQQSTLSTVLEKNFSRIPNTMVLQNKCT